MNVTAETLRLATDNQSQLGVSLQPKDSVNHMDPCLLQRPGPFDVGVLIESSLELDQHGHRLARLGGARFDEAVPSGSVQTIVGEATIVLPLADVIDIAQERARLEREIGKLSDDIGKIDKKLGNTAFTSKAPPAVVETQHNRRADAIAARNKLEAALGRLSA